MASKRTKIVVGVLLVLAVGGASAKFGFGRWKAARDADDARRYRVAHVDEATRDCRDLSADAPDRVASLDTCRTELDADIDREAAAGALDPYFAKKAHEDAAHELTQRIPAIAVVDRLSAKLRDERLVQNLREDRRWAIDTPHDLGAATLLASTIDENDHESDRHYALRTFRDHAMLDVLERVARIDKQYTSAHGHEAGFRGAVLCLLGDTKTGLATMASLNSIHAVIARRACGAPAASTSIPTTAWPEPEAAPFVPVAISLLPPLEASQPPEKALATLFKQANADPKIAAPKEQGVAFATLALGATPSKEHVLAWASATQEKCEQPRHFVDPWSLVTPPEVQLLRSPPVMDDPERDVATARGLKGGAATCDDGASCCAAKRVWSLGRALLYGAVLADLRYGHRAKAREHLPELEAHDPSIDTASLWLAIDGLDEAKTRAQKVLAAETAPSFRRVRAGLEVAAAELAQRNFAGAYASAERARNDRGALSPKGKEAPHEAMEALWIMVASGVMSGRAPPADLFRWETGVEERLRFQDKTRIDSEALALEVWGAGVAGTSQRMHMRRAIWGRREHGSDTECQLRTMFATLARDGDAEPWLDALDAQLEHKNFANWRGGAIARARCKAMALGVMGHPSAKAWSDRADRLGALIKDAKTAMLAHYVGL